MIITTRYLGPTDTLGSRVSATSGDKRKVLVWDHSLGSTENHIRAARALGYKGTFTQEPWKRGWLFVSVQDTDRLITFEGK